MNIFGYDIGWDDVSDVLGGSGGSGSWWDRWGTPLKNVGKVVANTGLSYLNESNKQDTRDSLYSAMQTAMQQDYQNQLAEYNSEVEQMNANAKARAQAAAANRAATMANQAAAMKAAKKANKTQQKGYKQAKARYQPYVDAALKLLPLRTEITASAIGGLSDLYKKAAAAQAASAGKDVSMFGGAEALIRKKKEKGE